MWLVSVISMGLLVALCAVGTFHNWYDDNLPQRVGMGCTAVGYGSLLFGQPELQPLAHLGMAVFGLGTAWKVWKFQHPKPPVPPTRFPWAGIKRN